MIYKNKNQRTIVIADQQMVFKWEFCLSSKLMTVALPFGRYYDDDDGKPSKFFCVHFGGNRAHVCHKYVTFKTIS